MRGYFGVRRLLLAGIIRRILASMVLAFCAEDPEVLSRIDLRRVVARVEAYILSLPAALALSLDLMLLLVEFSLPPLEWKLRPLSALPVKKRTAILSAWLESRWMAKRSCSMGARFLCLTQIYSEPALLEHLGYRRSRVSGGSEGSASC